MSLLDRLTVVLFAAWCLSEVAINLVNAVNRLSGRAQAEDRFSYLAIWLAVMVTVFLVVAAWLPSGPVTGFGNEGALWALLGWLGCASGLYMALTVWDLRQGWIATALASLFLLRPPGRCPRTARAPARPVDKFTANIVL
jgi:hypothetical protein